MQMNHSITEAFMLEYKNLASKVSGQHVIIVHSTQHQNVKKEYPESHNPVAVDQRHQHQKQTIM